MQALAIVGYIVMGIGIVLFLLTAVRKLKDDSGPSTIEVLSFKFSLPGTLILVVVGGMLAVIGTFGPTLTTGAAGPGVADGQATSAGAVPSTTTAPSPRLTINEPRPGMLVPEDGFSVSGTSNLRVTDTLWVVYRGLTNSNPSFQPQSAPCSIAVDGAFTCPAQYVGGPDDSGHEFELLFLLAEPSASKVFFDYEASAPAARGYPGLATLPPGVQQIGHVTVKRQ